MTTPLWGGLGQKARKPKLNLVLNHGGHGKAEKMQSLPWMCNGRRMSCPVVEQRMAPLSCTLQQLRTEASCALDTSVGQSNNLVHILYFIRFFRHLCGVCEGLVTHDQTSIPEIAARIWVTTERLQRYLVSTEQTPAMIEVSKEPPGYD